MAGKKEYDYLIVGAGLFGSTFAHQAGLANKKCLVIDKRDHIGGNCYTEDRYGVNVHVYGPHIFHTSNPKIWAYVNELAEFNNFVNRPKVNYRDKLYSFPINLFTLYQLYGVQTPQRAKEVLAQKRLKINDPQNLEDWCLSQVGHEIYKTFIYGYTKKQWGREPKDLPASIIRRIPIRLTFDDNYFSDTYQGIPVGGYTPIFEKMLKKAEVQLSTDYFEDRFKFDTIAKKVLYTGMIDEYYNYMFGELEYRGLIFQHMLSGVPDYQGNAVVNYTDENVTYTRIVEHAHFQKQTLVDSYITKEFPAPYKRGDIPYYPVGDAKNTETYNKYKFLADREGKTLFGGRLASYKYWDMHQVIGASLNLAEKEL